MRKFFAILKYTLIVVVSLLLILLIWLYSRYGGGNAYPDISTAPRYDRARVELVFSYPEPIGNVAATPDSGTQRLFFTIHPESRPQTYHLMEVVDGVAVPYPDSASQKQLFTSVLGLFADQQQRLWTIDHGLHGSEKCGCWPSICSAIHSSIAMFFQRTWLKH
jgi:hypothetical protein